MASGGYTLVAIPNRKWFCYYFGIFYGFLALIAWKFASIEREANKKTMSEAMLDPIACAILFHIMQNLRLNRFFKERRLKV